MVSMKDGSRRSAPGLRIPLATPLEMADALKWRRQPAAAAAQGPRPPPWWDFGGKYRAAERIMEEERQRRGGTNDFGDGIRHAEASRRLADETGPVFATIAGAGHEVANLLRDELPLSESVMDMINNAEGVSASVHRRSVDPAKIQRIPISLRAAAEKERQAQEDRSPNRAQYPSRPYGQGTAAKGYKDAPRPNPERRYPAY